MHLISRRTAFFAGFLLLSLTGSTQVYTTDVLGPGFESTTIIQPDDYEGKVTCTLVRQKSAGKPAKAVLYIHGFNDYFFQQEMANRFTAHGYRFYALDLRKYGRSWLPNQKLNNVRDLHEYTADIDTALALIRAETGAQVLLAGHSTGGLIATLYASEHQQNPQFDAVFLNSPFFDMNMPRLIESLGVPLVSGKGKKHPDKLLKGGLTPWYGLSLHKDAHGEWDYKLAWKPHNVPPVNAGWIRAIHRAQKTVQKGVVISQPLLVMHSNESIRAKSWTEELFSADAVLDVKDIHKYALKIAGPRTILTIDKGMHDLVLSTPEVRMLVYSQLFDWLQQNTALK
jgi:alpha-beta hydrolase superfamily lysophospholipase